MNFWDGTILPFLESVGSGKVGSACIFLHLTMTQNLIPNMDETMTKSGAKPNNPGSQLFSILVWENRQSLVRVKYINVS